MQNMFHKIPAESVATTIVIPSEGLPQKYIANRLPPCETSMCSWQTIYNML